MSDKFNRLDGAVTSRNFYAPAESDTDVLKQGGGVYVGGAGNLVVDNWHDQTITFTAVPAGTFIPIQIKRLRTATTATGVIVLA